MDQSVMTDPCQKSFGGRWSDEKLDALRAYLKAYTTALKNTPFKLAYIDAFAGAGTRELSQKPAETWFEEALVTEEAQYRHGSPLIALENEPAFDQFFFIEQDAESIARLKDEVAACSAFLAGRVKLLHGDANQHLQDLAKKNWVSHRAVAFLDPFALHVTWATLQKIAQTQAIDMWLLFPAMAVNRMLPRHGAVPEAWAAKLTETFGCADWQEFFYTSSGDDLFGDETFAKTGRIFDQLSEYITLRLKTIFAGVHEKPLILRNSTGSPLFLLCFACGNPRGVKVAVGIAQHIINRKSHGH